MLCRNEPLTFGSLFAGIGGFDLGFERAGMVCKWQVEIDEYCQQVLARHWPDVPRYGDVKDVGREQLEPVDVICGGFPCQPHSLAGKRRGATDDRNLWPEYRRIIAELQPAWVVAENVFGIVSTMLDTVLSDLEDLDYATIPLIVPACAFDAQHRRDRVFIIAHADSNGLEGQQQTRTATESIEREDRDAASLDTMSLLPGLLVYHPSTARMGMRLPTSRGLGVESIYQATAGVETESGFCGVVNGVPNRVDRIAALGDAVIPQAAEWIGQRIMGACREINST